MSIQINSSKCKGCGKCIEVCPGNLIDRRDDGKAQIKYPRDCWGCTSCLKECKADAISFFLGADIGGMGSQLHIKESGSKMLWTIHKWNGVVEQIEIDKRVSNQY